MESMNWEYRYFSLLVCVFEIFIYLYIGLIYYCINNLLMIFRKFKSIYFNSNIL